MDNNIELDKEEYTAVMRFIRFLKTHNYGEFTAVINTDEAHGLRNIQIGITEKERIRMKAIVKLV